MAVFSVTLPIFLIIALGFAATRAGLFEPDHLRAMGRLIINFTIPALIFRAMTQGSFGEVFNVRYLAAYGGAALAVGAVATSFALVVRRKPLTQAALFGMGASGSNSAMVGFPVAFQFMGPPAGIALALNLIVENIVMIPSGLTLAEMGQGKSSGLLPLLGRTFAGLARSPLIIAIAVGVLAAAVGFRPPGPIAKAIDMLATASAPVALFVIGGSLVGLKLQGMAGDLIALTTIKLLVHPLAVLAAINLVGLQDEGLRKAALVYGSAPMMSVLAVLGLKYGEERFTAAALLATTAASFVTFTGMLWLISHGWVR
jgi:malonate transporter